MPVTPRSVLLYGLAGFAAALLVRLASLDHRALWLDEALTQYAVSLDWAALVHDRIAAGHSPLYFLAMKALGQWATDLHTLRLAGAAMDSAACGLLAAAMARGTGGRAAILAALLYALHPLLLFWGQNARPYGMTMFWLALALWGAMGLIRNRASDDRIALSVGLAGASLTLTGGAIAALIVALSPLGSAALRRDAGFRKVWLRCLILPALCLLAMILIVSLPSAEALQGSYWTQRYLPFTVENLRILLLELGAGDRFAHGNAQTLPSRSAVLALALPLLLGQGAAILWAFGAVRKQPALMPLLALALAYPMVLIALSTSTSLLVARYFLPGVAAGLMLMAAGLAEVSRRGGGALLAAGAVVAMALLALNNSVNVGYTRNAGARALADVVFALTTPQTRLFAREGDGAGLALQTELLIDRMTKGTPPPIRPLPPDLAKDLAEPVFLVLSERFWPDYAQRLPVPDCRWSRGGSILAYWGPTPGRCPAISE